MMDERLLTGILHLDVRHGAVAENRASLFARAEEAAAGGARVIVAPEFALSGYSFEGMDEIAPYVEELTGETVSGLSRIARRFGVYICTGLAEYDRKTGILYNSAVVLGPDGRLAALHRKHVAERRWSCPGQPSGWLPHRGRLSMSSSRAGSRPSNRNSSSSWGAPCGRQGGPQRSPCRPTAP